MIGALLLSMRPKQWTKNLLLFAGYLFTIEQIHPPSTWLRVLGAVGLFCAVSGAGYIINDVIDIERDRLHPRKRDRPIAAGKLSVALAVPFAIVLLAAGIYGSFALDLYFGALIVSYVVLAFAYSICLKHIVIVDLLAIAAGFVIRAAAGAVVVKAIDPVTGIAHRVEVSPWLLVCTTLLALFLGLAKRRSELLALEETGTSHRRTLGQYSAPMLDQMLNIAASASLMAYFLYTFTPTSKTGAMHPHMMITAPFVIYGLFRYLYLMHANNAGSSPELTLIEDKPLLIDVVLYVIAAVIALKV